MNVSQLKRITDKNVVVLEFIKNNQTIDGLFVVYHGITDMLRVGDFSLYANGIGIVGVGELKSQREGDHISVTANITLCSMTNRWMTWH